PECSAPGRPRAPLRTGHCGPACLPGWRPRRCRQEPVPALRTRSCLGLAECRNGGLDDATAEAHLALIEDDGLARCHRSLRLIEANQPAAFDRFQCAVLVRLAIADLGCEAQGLLYVHGVDPIDERALECAGKQPGVIAGPLQAADAQPLALTYGVVHQAVMAADDLAVGGLDLAGLGGQIAFEKVAEATLPDEADAGRILLACGRQLVLFRDAPHL